MAAQRLRRGAANSSSAAPAEQAAPRADVEAGILLVAGGRVAAANAFVLSLLGYELGELLGVAADMIIDLPATRDGEVVAETGMARLRRKGGAMVMMRYETRELPVGDTRVSLWVLHPRRLATVHPVRPANPRALTLRELEILQLVADGLENDEIADALYISKETVKSHLRRLLQKLQARSRTHAVAVAFRSSLVE